MTLQKFIYTTSWVFLFTFLVPTGLILASWNAVPGDRLYSVKVGLEQTLLLAVSPSYAAQGNLQLQYTKRRIQEVEKIANTEYGKVGVTNLRNQVADTNQTIHKINNKTQQTQLAKKYVQELRETQKKLEQQKQIAIAAKSSAAPTIGGSPTKPAPSPTSTSRPKFSLPSPKVSNPPPPPTAPSPTVTTKPVNQPSPIVAQPSPLPSADPVSEPPPTEIEDDIEDAQENIEEVIEDLEELVGPVEDDPGSALPPQSQGVGVPQGGRDNNPSNENSGEGTEADTE